MLDVRKEQFGFLPDGQEVSLYLLRNDAGATLAISDFGAIIQSLRFPSASGEYRDVVLGYDRLDDYLRDDAYMGACVGPYANRIARAELPVADAPVQLDANEGDNCLHSGVDSVARKFFRVEKKDKSNLLFHYKLNEGDSHFPGSLELTIHYSFDDDMCLKIQYFARSSEDSFFNFTNHSYFNLNGAGVGRLAEMRLSLNSSFYAELDEKHLPTGAILPLADTYLDLRESRRLGAVFQAQEAAGEAAGLDDYFFVDGSRAKMLRHFASLSSEDEKLKMDLHSNESGLQVYTATALSERVGKSGAHYGPFAAICLETGKPADSPHFYHFPNSFVAKNQVYHSKNIFKFSSKL
ncbi:MAG: aldose epimerase family protein [Eubacteriales bacterium]|nr:aldose epimerase family protein [Eubacteriales bacterium]